MKYRKIIPLAGLAALFLLAAGARTVFLSHAAETYYQRGVHLDEQGHPEEALKAFQKAIRLQPALPHPHYSLGIVLNKLHRFSEAVAPFRQAVQLSPDYVVAYHELGATYAELGQDERAADAFQQAIARAPDMPLAHYNLGLIYARLGFRREALREHDRLQALDADLAAQLFAYLWWTGTPAYPLGRRGDPFDFAAGAY